ncbi:MAG: glycerol-3-phosphate dehydrogenase C-terminal domain-containing protein, partial [Solirubrobacteraceae bacterium]
RTHHLPIVGAPPDMTRLPGDVPARLWRRFGTEAREVMALANGRPELLEPISPGLPVLGVELLAAVQREGALNVDDVLDRRTRLGLVPAWRQAARVVAEELLEDHAAPAAVAATSGAA